MKNNTQAIPRAPDERVDVIGSLPFFGVHLVTLLVFWTGISWTSAGIAFALYVIRMFAITGGYHRYFSHRTYKTSRFFQFCLAFLGTSCAQQGPLWWAAHHRHHHRYSDLPEDIHSPTLRGFWWAHAGWIICKKYEPTRTELIADFAKYPELRFLNRYHLIAPILLAVAVWGLGWFLEVYFPGLGCTKWQALIVGFFISTVVLYHGTFTINSLSHLFGKRRYETEDTSRNNIWLAFITLGEGWHNNHHRYPFAEQQGFFWWEVDITHYVLKTLSLFRIVWDIKVPPAFLLEPEKNQAA